MAEDKNKYVLSINGMSKSFGRNKVLNHINLNVRPGTIMGLMGENGAGKSTMMKCLFGTYQKDEGTIILDGKEVNFSGPKDALENGVAMVHQELNQCLERSVIDNMFLGRYPKNSLGMIDEGRMRKETSDLFRKLGITVNLTQPMKKMSVSQRQMCEIAKAISYHSKVIVLDEPTSSLTAPEVAKLFKMMRQLKEQGISLIYISHKMDEIFEICDEISVLRDGSRSGGIRYSQRFGKTRSINSCFCQSAPTYWILRQTWKTHGLESLSQENQSCGASTHLRPISGQSTITLPLSHCLTIRAKWISPVSAGSWSGR